MSETNEKPQASKAKKPSTSTTQSLTESVVSGREEVTRNDLRLAFIQAGSVRVHHVRADAQQVERAIDELFAMWDEK